MNRLVFKKNVSIPIFNIETFEGSTEIEDDVFECIGFDENGTPVFSRVKGELQRTPENKLIVDVGRAHYKLTGQMTSGIAILNPNSSIVPKDKINEFLERFGGNCSVYQEFQIFGMLEPYYKCSDEWQASRENPEVTYDLFNEFLAKLGSKWRIKTLRATRLLIKLQMDKLFKGV